MTRIIVKGVMTLVAALVLGAGSIARAEIRDVSEVYQALEAGRYREVEAFYDKLRKARTRDAQGRFLFEEFTYKTYWYSSSNPKEGGYWPKVDAATKAWLSHSPNSHLAAMTRAYVLAYRANSLDVRGGSWDEANRLAAEAGKLMEASRRAGASDALWHAVRLRVASAQGLPRAEVIKLIHAAVAVDPYPVRLWLEASIALSPDGRSSSDLAWLMQLARKHTFTQEGISMEARVLDATYWRFHDFVGRPFHGGQLNWKSLHASFLDWKKRYPAGYAGNLHGALACSAQDRAVTGSVIAELGSRVDHQAWEFMGGKDHMTRCKDWANTVPGAVKT